MTEIGLTTIEPRPENVRTWLTGRVAHYLRVPADSIRPDVPIADYGLDSVYAFVLCGEIEDTLNVAIEPTLLWDVENLMDLTVRLVELSAGPAESEA